MSKYITEQKELSFSFVFTPSLIPRPCGRRNSTCPEYNACYPGNSNTNAYTHMNAPPFIQ